MRITNLSTALIVLFLGILSCMRSSSIHAMITPLGAGSYRNGIPTGALGPSDQENRPVTPQVSTRFNQLPTTHTWWTSLIWKFRPNEQHSWGLFAHPLVVKATPQGATIGYSNQAQIGQPIVLPPDNHTNQEYHYPYVQDLLVGIAGLNAQQTAVERYSDWSVTAVTQSGPHQLKMTITKGSPFVFFEIQGGNAVITASSQLTVWYNNNGTLGLTINGKHYGIFGPSGSIWNGTQQLSSTLANKNYLSIALLPDNNLATLQFYRNYAYSFITNTQVEWEYDEAQATMITTYRITTEQKEGAPSGGTLFALYRHQWLNTSASLLPYTYVSPRGIMKVVAGSGFTTTMQFNGVLPEIPLVVQDGQNTFSNSKLFEFVDSLYKADFNTRWNNLLNGNQAYWVGKAVGRMARLVHIAHAIHHSAAFNLFLKELKDMLQAWFTGDGDTYFYYDPTWKTLIAHPPTYFSDTMLNDHHFQYGYFILAAATIQQFDPTWGTQNNWGGMVELLIKDTANWNRNDSMFPFLRHFDIYEGHCWASGHSGFFPGANEESSSESINFAMCLIMWGSLTDNKTIRDLGIYIYTHQTRAIEEYWFDVDNQVFPPDFPKEVLGMVWGDGGGYSVWFEGSINMIHGINFLPITSGSVYLGRRPDYLQRNHHFMFTNPGNHTDWMEIHMGVMALYDSQKAIDTFNTVTNYTREGGDSQAHVYYWIHNMHVLGKLDTSITANTPLYNVFVKNNTRTYIAYNPSTTLQTIRFSDGTQLEVQPKSYAVKGAPYNPNPNPNPEPPTESFSVKTKEENNQLLFTVTLPTGSTFATLHYSINNGAYMQHPMIKNNETWIYSLTELKKDDKISYYVTYDIKSETHMHTFGGGGTPQPPSEQFSLKVQQQSPNNLKFLVTTPNTSKFADIHYKINNADYLHYRMSKTSSGWEYIVSGLKADDRIEYYATYELNGPTIISPTEIYIMK